MHMYAKGTRANRLFVAGLMTLALAIGGNQLMHTMLGLPESVADLLGGCLFGVAIGLELLAVGLLIRTRHKAS
jgi:hypothetical protein